LGLHDGSHSMTCPLESVSKVGSSVQDLVAGYDQGGPAVEPPCEPLLARVQVIERCRRARGRVCHASRFPAGFGPRPGDWAPPASPRHEPATAARANRRRKAALCDPDPERPTTHTSTGRWPKGRPVRPLLLRRPGPPSVWVKRGWASVAQWTIDSSS
jgi:hypothetical protein